MGQGRSVVWDIVEGRVDPPPTSKLLGWKAIELGNGVFRAEFQATDRFYNPAGTVQGGILAAMLDDTIGPAAVSLLGAHEMATTLELKVSYVRPVRAGKIIGEAKVIHKGRSVIFMEGSLRTPDGELIAAATSTMRIVRFDPDAHARKDGTDDKR